MIYPIFNEQLRNGRRLRANEEANTEPANIAHWQCAQSVKSQRIISILIISLKMQTGNDIFGAVSFFARP